MSSNRPNQTKSNSRQAVSAESLIKSIGDSPIPPVEKWDPEYCGELELIIKSDGSWLYGGTPLTRRKIQLLFSRVIKKEGDDYFLVTPVEKLSIQVEWLPFVIVDFEVIDENNKKIFRFFDNCDNQVDLMASGQLKLSLFKEQWLPSILIRRNLYAGISRQCYYRLIAEADIDETNDTSHVQLTSNGIVFSLGEFEQT
ncbi:DUF1285 domain-containing protein [Aliikangiella coralliicola]|uniref:DUF1285 domain-containing protein n=1 Tax=Aliikangiella coralliicola TaxID=2592383 RepID=A0A545UIE5_9GAMM|nr:DUF1285 domain-containing protein [Aliikangiella coralliicola]TQV89241.1 DUF1285 domain-containing protein [Aliikangiella coralliicola]